MTGVAEISVIVPAREGERYLAEALDSAASQTRPPAEVIVVDDGSEETRRTAEGCGPLVSCISRPRPGSGAALNAGVGAAAGGMIAILDADDIWMPGKLELQAAELDGDPGLDLVFSAMEEFFSPELSEAERAQLAPPRKGGGPLKSTLLARRRAFETVGRFDEGLGVGDFLEWLARARDAGLRERVLPQTLLKRRLHPHSWGRQADRSEYVRTLATVVRRRQSGTSP